MEFHIWLLCCLTFLCSTVSAATASSADIVSALTDIDQAIAAGRSLASELTAYVNTEEARLIKLRQIIQRLENATDVYPSTVTDYFASSSATQDVTSNPVSAFLTVLQLASNWTSELSDLFGVPNESINNGDFDRNPDAPLTAFREFDSRRKLFLRLKWYADMLPSDSDVQSALDAIIRLQQTYQIPAIDIADGQILPSSPSPRLTGRFHLLIIGSMKIYTRTHTSFWAFDK